MDRRAFLASAAGVALGGLAAPALAQSRPTVRVGYLHTLAADGQIWTGIDLGCFAKQGVYLDLSGYDSGPEAFDALADGKLDVVSVGAAVANYPARGQGKVFLVNDIEVSTAQLWVHRDMGIKTFADLKGKRIATAKGTTAQIFLDRALRTNKIDPKDVELVDQSMPLAVNAFIAGSVAAVALWMPFNVMVRNQVPDAVKLTDASAYFPQASAIGGWAASDDYFGANKEALTRLIRGWAEANDQMVAHSEGALAALQKAHYPAVSVAELREQFKAQKMFSSRDWSRMYADGTVLNWLQQSTEFFMADAGLKTFTPAAKYFDPSVYLKTMAAETDPK